MSKYQTLISSLVLCAALASCTSETEPTIKPADSQVATGSDALTATFTGKYDRFAKGEPYTGKVTTEWSDTLWRGERTGRQIMLTSTAGSIGPLSYSVSDLTCGESTIPASNVALRTVGYASGDAQAMICGMQENRTDIFIGDVLRNNVATTLSDADPLKIWVTVDIPSDAPAGHYSGTISVKVADATVQQLSLKFLVTNHTLPQPKDWNFHLDIWQFPFQLAKICNTKPFTPEYYNLVRPFYALLADAGQKAVTTYIKDGAFSPGCTMIDWSLANDGTWTFNYSNFDAYVDFMASLGIDKQINCFSLGGWMRSIGYTDLASNTYKHKSLTIGTDEYDRVWSAFLADFRAHLQQNGLFDKTVLYMDENTQDDMEHIVSLISADSRAWKIGLAGREIAPATERRLYDYSTILGYDRASTNNTIATFYTSCAQDRPNNYVALDTDPAEMTWMAWHAMAKGFNGYTRWAYDYWTCSDPFDLRDGTNTAGDFSMIYRSSNAADARPLSSIRLELLREGIQDYEKALILDRRRMRDVIAPCADCHATDYRALVLAGQARIKKMSTK